MKNQFSRTELLIGKDAIRILENSKVAVFGIGGVGGYTAEALVRSGVGTVDIIDDDKVCITNINRQLIATHSTIGEYKVDIMTKRLLDINPQLKITGYKCFYSAETAESWDFGKYDYIVDAIDTVSSKIEMIVRAKQADTPIISCMGAGNKLDPAQFEVADIYSTTVCPLAKVMRKELKSRNIDNLKVVYSREVALKPKTDLQNNDIYIAPTQTRKGAVRRQTPGSMAFVPSVAGLIIASEVIKDLIAPINQALT